MTTTKENRVRMSELHSDHTLWINTLEFCKEEISILEHRIEDIATRNTHTAVMAELEHFQNQYIRQREVIDEMLHELKLHEQELVKEAKANPVALDHRLFPDHVAHRDKMATFEKLYAELKSEFMAWLVKRM